MKRNRKYHKLFMIFAFIFCVNVHVEPIGAYSVRCGHAKDAYTLNCRLADIEDNTTLTTDFPGPLRPLAQYVTHISISKSLLATLPTDIFNLFENLESLTVHAALQNLTQRHLQNATKLSTLKLGLSNHIDQLESSLFVHAPTLEYIDLAYNDISDIGENVFGGLSKLQYLYLEGNRIAKLRNSTFAGATNLQVLELGRNEISEIEEDAFRGLANLRVLTLNRNQIAILQATIFHGTPHLERIDVSLNGVSELEDGVFDGMDRLVLIEMGFNNLTVLPDSAFAGAANLQKLFLSWNRLESIAEPFKGLDHLRLLDLSFNELGNISADILSNRTKLEQLELRATGLTELPIDLLQQQTELQLLDLSLNNLSLTDTNFEAFRPLHKLQVLKLENTSLIGISDELKNITPALRFLNLASNPVDCGSVHILVDFFVKNNIEYEFGQEIDVGCTLLPYESIAFQAYDLSHSQFLDVKDVLGPDYVDPLPPAPFPPLADEIFPPGFSDGFQGGPDGPGGNGEGEFVPEKVGQQLFSFELNPQSLTFTPTANDTRQSANRTDINANGTVSTTSTTSTTTTTAAPSVVTLQTSNGTEAVQADLQSKTIYLFNIGKILSEFTNDTVNTPVPPARNESGSQSVSLLPLPSDNATTNATAIQADIQTKSIYLFNIAKIISDLTNSDTEIVNSLSEYGADSDESNTEPDVTSATAATTWSDSDIANDADSTVTTNDIDFDTTTMTVAQAETRPTDLSIETTESTTDEADRTALPISNASIKMRTQMNDNNNNIDRRSEVDGSEVEAKNSSHRNSLNNTRRSGDKRNQLANGSNEKRVHNSATTAAAPAAVSTTTTKQTGSTTHALETTTSAMNGTDRDHRPGITSNRNQNRTEERNVLGTLKDGHSKGAYRGKIRYEMKLIAAASNAHPGQSNRVSRTNSQLRNRGRIKYRDALQRTPSD